MLRPLTTQKQSFLVSTVEYTALQKTAELLNIVLECTVMLSVVFTCGTASQLWSHYDEIHTDGLKSWCSV